MKRLLLLLTICTLISSCGLFKTKTKVSNKQETTAVAEQKTEKQVFSTEDKKEQSTSKSTENTQESNSLDIDSETTITADKITGNKEGFTAEGNAKLTNKNRDKSIGEKKVERTIDANSVTEVKATVESRNKGELKTKATDKNSGAKVTETPSVKGLLIGGLVVLLIGTIVYLKVRK